jgi:dienelactone hydrolase
VLIVRSYQVILFFTLILGVLCAGCEQNTAPVTSTYTVDAQGVLTISCAPASTSEEVLFTNDTYTKSRIVLHTEKGDVVTYLASPKAPTAAVVYAPGAGEKIAGHEDRMVRFTKAGYAFLFVDTRGNSGETTGSPFGQKLIEQDYIRFEHGEMPQYYLSICDLIAGRKLLTGRYAVPVYVAGSSNGGRYAAVAAGVEPQFAGYIGISTSDWGLLDSLAPQGYTGSLLRFAESIEPSTYIGKISPRPVWMFHAQKDPIIPFETGKLLFQKAREPKNFTEFSGDHGINPDVDNLILRQWAQIYGNRG